MNQEILDKLHAALYTISPLADERERIIAEMGEIIWLSSLERVLSSLDEESRTAVVGYLNDDKLEEAVSLCETKDINVEVIIEEEAKKVLQEVLSTGQ